MKSGRKRHDGGEGGTFRWPQALTADKKGADRLNCRGGMIPASTPQSVRMSRVHYRPEIDGLRALAVLAVVFFHSQLKFPGGYVGVDIFFVISGYLITAIIAADLAAGRFSLRDFWERRIRRIMPAATATVAVSLLAGAALMLPSDFAELGRSAVAQAVLSANVFFYSQSGYFDGPAGAKPLLHFWSLAVEEQFYLLFPFLLLALHRWRAGAQTWGIAAIAGLSFAASVVGVHAFPSATFYLLPTRAWELAIGALLALRGNRLPLPERARGWLGWAGVALMIAPMALYDTDTPFPGLAAVPPCVGAALVIWATGAGESRLKQLLSLRPVVWVGLISYSLYLWHWPVKVFSHYWFTGLYSPLPMRVAVVIVSFGLAWLSWRYIEKPFRRKRAGAPALRPVLAAAAASIGLTIVAGGAVAARHGVPERFPEAVARFDEAHDDRPEMEEADLTTEAAEAGNLPVIAAGPPSPSVLVWGDSHARVASPAVESACRELGVRAYRASRSATPAVLAWGDEEQRAHNAAVLRWIRAERPTLVVLVSRWEKVLRSPEDEAALAATVRTLADAGVTVSLMRQVAAQQRDIPKSLAKAALLGEDVDAVGVRVADHARFTHRSNEIIDRIAAREPHLRVIDPIPYLARDGRCLAEEGGRALYYDYQHLTRHGAEFLRPMFASLIQRVAVVPPPRGSYSAVH